jgi:3-hydroxyisobutyrate dehydrogenase
MGAGMARSLLRDGFEVIVWNRSPEKAKLLEADGAVVADTCWSAVARADVVITMLFDARATLDVAARFLGSMGHGSIWMQSATVGTDGMTWLADLAAQYDVGLVDAPVVGSKAAAEDGGLVVLASGNATNLRNIRPVFDAIGTRTIVVGPTVGQASALKLACNAWVASLTAATAQSLAMCEQLGVDPKLFLDAIDAGPSDSVYAHLKGEMMLERSFVEPAFAVDGIAKDLDLMIDAVGPDQNPLLPALREAFRAASATGHGNYDIAAVFTAFV